MERKSADYYQDLYFSLETQELVQIASDWTQPLIQRLSTLYILLCYEPEIDVTGITAQIPELRVPISGDLPLSVREAIVIFHCGRDAGHWAPDIRWAIEALELERKPQQKEDESILWSNLITAMRATGLKVELPNDRKVIPDYQGADLWIEDYRLFTSSIGPFIAIEDDGKGPPSIMERCINAATAANWVWLDDVALKIRFNGIERGEVDEVLIATRETVGSLLYIWPDFSRM